MLEFVIEHELTGHICCMLGNNQSQQALVSPLYAAHWA